MFVPVSTSVDPIKPKRGFLTARPVVRSDDPDKSESTDNSPRWQDGHPEDAPHHGGCGADAAASGQEAAAPEDELFQENAELARHLLLQRAEPMEEGRAGETGAAFHGYEEVKALSA